MGGAVVACVAYAAYLGIMSQTKRSQLHIIILACLGIGVFVCGAGLLTAWLPRDEGWRANEGQRPPTPEEIAAHQRKQEDAAAARSEREEFVNILRSAGWARRSGWVGSSLELAVTSSFMRMDLTEKESLCRRLFAIAERENEHVRRIVFVDVATGKRLGEYSPTGGVTID